MECTYHFFLPSLFSHEEQKQNQNKRCASTSFERKKKTKIKFSWTESHFVVTVCLGKNKNNII